MATIDHHDVRTGHDVEVVLSARYLQVVLQTAYDAGLLPSSLEIDGTVLALAGLPQDVRLYEPTDVLLPNGEPLLTAAFAFDTEILVGRPDGANVRVRVVLQTGALPTVSFWLLAHLALAPTVADGAISELGLDLVLVDIEGPFDVVAREYPSVTKDVVMAAVRAQVDRRIDLGAVSSGQRVENVELAWLEPGAGGEAAVGLYLDLRLRNGDAADAFAAPRGDTALAVNFLPAGEDVAMATRAGLYADMEADTWARTAVKSGTGYEHALRKDLLDPDDDRIGDLSSVRVAAIPGLPPPGGWGNLPVGNVNGLRLRLDGEYVLGPTDTDVTFTVDLVPRIDGDGLLQWDTDLDVGIDATFEWTSLLAIGLTGLVFGPGAAGVLAGVLLGGGAVAGVVVGLMKSAKTRRKADAVLRDVVPDRLTIATRRWDPFYATVHQVVVKPSQAEFDEIGFRLCGRAFVGRDLVPPADTVIRDETRDAAGAVAGWRYRFPDHETIAADGALVAPGSHRRPFTPPDPAEPELFTLTADEFASRLGDPDGRLVLGGIRYFPAAVHVVGHQIAHLLCLSASELDDARDLARITWKTRVFAEEEASQGADIRAEVETELAADGTPGTEEEILVEVERRLQEVVDARADDEFRAPTDLQLAFDGSLREVLRFDLTPQEWLTLQARGAVLIGDGVQSVPGGPFTPGHLRDRGEPAVDADGDNLLERPRYRPGPSGPVFVD